MTATTAIATGDGAEKRTVVIVNRITLSVDPNATVGTVLELAKCMRDDPEVSTWDIEEIEQP